MRGFGHKNMRPTVTVPNKALRIVKDLRLRNSIELPLLLRFLFPTDEENGKRKMTMIIKTMIASSVFYLFIYFFKFAKNIFYFICKETHSKAKAKPTDHRVGEKSHIIFARNLSGLHFIYIYFFIFLFFAARRRFKQISTSTSRFRHFIFPSSRWHFFHQFL